ncbi:hypothetical protein VCHA57P527_350001 [Vibrio chagasii]|nr:hypothetical protein VCHA57P527_350001 [Vibrio chagasii]
MGGLGAERYEFNRGDGHDTIRDRDFYGTSVDQIIFGEGIAREELSLRRDGNHMVLLIGGPDSGDLITIENAYTDSQYCIEEVVLTDGTTFILLELPEYSEVETGLLVQSMSSFDGFDLSLTTSSALTSVDVLSPPLVASNQN